jgi:uncharacterized protein
MIKQTAKTQPKKKQEGSRPEQLWQDHVYRPYTQYEGPRPPTAQRPVEVDNVQLPQKYDQTRLAIIPRDPHWLHAYWELSHQSVDEMRNRLGAAFDAAKYVLRMHDISKVEFNGNNANHTFDIEVAPHTNNWYLNLWCDNISCCGQIGVKTPDGQFHSFAQSNMISTPRASYSDRSDLIWMDVKDKRAIPFIYKASRRQRIERALNSAHVPLRFKDNGVRKIYLTEDDVRQYYSTLFPILSRLRRRRKKEDLDRKESLARKKSLSKFQQSREWVQNLLFHGMAPNEYYKKFLSGASEELGKPGGASETLSSGASEKNQTSRPRKFFFELWTELLVYGRTEPDATVRHGDKVVPLRSDGTFSMRFALPDTKIPLDFSATSNDKVETRKIATAVERFRTYYDPKP